MEVFSNIVLNLQAPAFATVFSPQGQTLSRSIQATLMDGATPWEIPETALCIIRYAKPDGTKGFYDTLEDDSSAYSYNGNVVTFGLATQALTVPGTVLMQLDFYNSDGEKLTTFTFRLIVAEGVFVDSDIASEDFINVLTAKLTEAAEIFQQIKAAYGAPLTANTAAAMTDTSRVYVYTGTTGGGFTNGHWYYWDGTAWADGGNYNSTGFTTDTSLSIAGAAADAKATGDAVGDLNRHISDVEENQIPELKSAIPSGLVYGSRMAVSGNLFPFAEDTVDGKYYVVSDGALVTSTNANYYGFILAVNPNTEYHCTFARFLCLLDENKVPSADMQSSTTIINTANAKYVAISFDKTLYSVESYCISIGSTLDNTPYKIELPWLFNDTTITKILPNGISVSANNPAANSTLIALDYSNNVKYNKSYVYMARFSGSIGDITLYHGSGTYSTYLRITQNSILVSSSGTGIYNEPHGLTIADYLYVFVDTDDNDGAVVRVMSNGKLATATVSGWQGWQGQVFALTASALTYHRLDVVFKDCNLPIWVFGDSYLSKTSNERWGYYLKQWGIDKYMAVGYPGAGSANVYQTLINMLKITQPKYLVWALGMNDPDNGEINSAWLTAANNVVALCKQYNIVPIFSKIPNAKGSGTLYDHSYKNAWIEASGYRYIDVPSAVGADSSGNWFTDLLATDGIHPSWRGAEAIAYQFIADVPELTFTDL